MDQTVVGFPSMVKRVRNQLNLSQEDLARELGVSFSTVNRWENGKTNPIRVVRAHFDSFCARMIRSGKLNRNTLEQQ